MAVARDRLIALRKQERLTQKDIASALGITASYYGMIEQGVRTPTLNKAQQIAEYFGVKMEDIFFNTPNNDMLSDRQEAS